MRPLRARFLKHQAAGFTMIELSVSVAILLIISVAVAGDINRTQYQEELNESARVLAGALRDLQTRALAASSVNTCMAGTVRYVCEISSTACTGTCGTLIPPYAYGTTLTITTTGVTRFAEVDVTQNDRSEGTASKESLGRVDFIKVRNSSNFVTINSLTVDGSPYAIVRVTFERQNGTMRINACDTPTPYTPPCTLGPEGKVLVLVLRHSRTNISKTLRLNSVTGKISLE